MKIRFLGTGTSTGIPEIGCRCATCTSSDSKDKRLRCSVQILVKNKQIIIDCTPDFRTQMMPVRFHPIDALLITHEHYDHVGGIDDLRPYCRVKAVPIYAEKNVCDALRQRIPYCFSENKYKGVPEIELREIDLKPFDIDGLQVIPIRVMHHKLPILGYRLCRFAYLTDVKYLPESEFDKLVNLDVLIISALREWEHLSHQTLKDALVLSKKINPKRTYIIHMSHDMGIHDTVQKKLPQNVFLAYDNLEITVDSESKYEL